MRCSRGRRRRAVDGRGRLLHSVGKAVRRSCPNFGCPMANFGSVAPAMPRPVSDLSAPLPDNGARVTCRRTEEWAILSGLGARQAAPSGLGAPHSKRIVSMMLRLLLCSQIACLAVLAAPPAFAQQRLPDGDQPGYEPNRRTSSSIRNSSARWCSSAPPSSPGTIVVHTSERFLYLDPAGRARRCATASASAARASSGQGLLKITRKQEWPDWRPPPEMIERQPYLPRFMAGGPGNPMGARALYLGGTVYRIHGTNQPQTIGYAVSSGCFRLVNPRRHRPLRPRSGRHQGRRPAGAGSLTQSSLAVREIRSCVSLRRNRRAPASCIGCVIAARGRRRGRRLRALRPRR